MKHMEAETSIYWNLIVHGPEIIKFLDSDKIIYLGEERKVGEKLVNELKAFIQFCSYDV